MNLSRLDKIRVETMVHDLGQVRKLLVKMHEVTAILRDETIEELRWVRLELVRISLKANLVKERIENDGRTEDRD